MRLTYETESLFTFYVLYIHAKEKPKNTEKITFIQVKAKSNYSLQIPFAVLNTVRSIKPNIILSGSIQTDIICGLLSLICRVPWISRYPSNPYFAEKHNKLKFVIQMILYKIAKLIICNSRDSLKYFKKNGFKNVLLLPNHISNVFIDNRNYKSTAPMRFLCVSRLVQDKRILNALSLFGMINEDEKKTLTIVGSGPQKKELIRYVSSQNIKNVKFIDFKNETYLSKLYNSHNIFLFLSKSESFPNVVLEAYLCNLKLVLSDIKAHRNNFSTKNKILLPLTDDAKNALKVKDFCSKPFIKNIKKQDKEILNHNLAAVAKKFGRLLFLHAKR